MRIGMEDTSEIETYLTRASSLMRDCQIQLKKGSGWITWQTKKLPI